MLLAVVVAAAVAGAAGGAAHNGSRHGFYRAAEGGAGGTRRVFGGTAAPLHAWGAVCALLDRYWATRCSAAVLAPRWALTAAHCVSPRIAYVKYNARRPAASEGDVTPADYLYRHPEYKVVQEDEGRGMDVTTLHHDVGLVRTRADMTLAAPPLLRSMDSLRMYDPLQLASQEVEVLGFGRTESSSQGEVLFAARMVLAPCERGGWFHCVCGVGARGGGGGAGVCAGDSGGPVLFRGSQVAVTSMGPLECAGGAAGGGGAPATSVFTALRQYVPLLNATITEADGALHMARLAATARAPPRLLLAACLAALVATARAPRRPLLAACLAALAATRPPGTMR